MKIYLPDIIKSDGSLNLEGLPNNRKTKFISITGQNGSGKTNLRDGLAKYLSYEGNVVITAESPCDKHLVKLLNNAIGQNEYKDWYTEQMVFNLADGLLSNYMIQIKEHCDYFICKRGPIDQYASGLVRSGKTYSEIFNIQCPNNLAKFDMYIHLNCNADVAWKRVCNDEEKSKYESLEYFYKQEEKNKELFEEITSGNQKELEIFRSSYNVYIDTTNMVIPEVFVHALEYVKNYFRTIK